MRLRVDLSDIERGGAMTVTGTMPDGTIRQRIAIDAVPTAFGGWRCYFICPTTMRRCEIVYYACGRFASREAQRLSYAVQNMGDLSRIRRKVAKLRSGIRGIATTRRVRGSHRIEIMERLQDAEREAVDLYRDRLRASIERSGTPRIPGAQR